MKFQPKQTDFERSPYTGMTRQTWIEAAEYLLDGIFRHIPSALAPVIVPRQETKITYPHADAPKQTAELEKRAEIFEGLARSFLIAAPLLHCKPKVRAGGYQLLSYYRSHILRCCTKGDPLYVGDYETLQELSGDDNPLRAFQQTVETCALVIGLWACEEELWNSYTKEEQDTIAALLSSYAHAGTVPQNWRLFNMLDLAFLHRNGYPIDRAVMMDHAQAILEYYVGDGWYRDGQSFDYYSCWAFNFYAPLWNVWYGYENEPYLAARFEEHANALAGTYPDFFDEDGFTNMWGRSNIYRFAAASPLEGNFLLRQPAMDPGLARRIASGTLLQFLTREDFLQDGIPTMGFYRQFAPLVQGYSCAESPFWMGKLFLCLHLPEGHPFWMAKENNGTWEILRPGDVKETTLNGPALCFTNHKSNASTILRTGKVIKAPGDIPGLWNYGKLAYHSKYPWEATPVPVAAGGQIPVSPDVAAGEVEAQQYVLHNLRRGGYSLCNATYFAGERDGILYRRQFFDYRLDTELHWLQGLYLADFPVAEGILRVDKLKLFERPVSLTLGSFGIPDHQGGSGGASCIRRQEGNAHAMIIKGQDACGRKKQVAMTIYDGWESLDCLRSRNTNPDSEYSYVIYAKTSRRRQYDGYEPYLLISQVITRESHEDFSMEELFPIRKIKYTDAQQSGAYGTVTLVMKEGTERVICYDCLEASLSR